MALINTTTADLPLDKAGNLVVETNPTRQAVQLRIFTRRGSCFWDRTFGSRLHLAPRMKIGAGFQAQLEDLFRSALRPLLDAGEIRELAFEHERPAPTQWHARLTMLDAGKRPLAFDYWVEVGGP